MTKEFITLGRLDQRQGSTVQKTFVSFPKSQIRQAVNSIKKDYPSLVFGIVSIDKQRVGVEIQGTSLDDENAIFNAMEDLTEAVFQLN